MIFLIPLDIYLVSALLLIFEAKLEICFLDVYKTRDKLVIGWLVVFLLLDELCLVDNDNAIFDWLHGGC